jgi:hypothetical protein
MKFLCAHQLAVVACLYRCIIALFRGFLLQVTAPISHTTGRLLAVSQDTARISDSCNTAWEQSGLCTPLSWLQHGKGSSVWISCETFMFPVRLLGRGEYSLWLFLLKVIDGWYTFVWR